MELYADPATPSQTKEIDPNRRLVLRCASGGRSALAARALHEIGSQNVAPRDGGFKAWKEADQATETPR